MIKTKTLVIGLDPGTGSKSPCGYSAFCPETKEIVNVRAIWTEFKEPRHRIKDICDAAGYQIDHDKDEVEYSKTVVCIERFVMRGESGETLQQLIGGLMTKIPFTFDYKAPYNTTVKRVVGGSGKADKEQVAMGVADYFSTNKTSVRLVAQLTRDKEWDILDSLAIGIAGISEA